MTKVIIGSQNPVKIEATKQAFMNVFPNEVFEFIGISVPSDVSDQPMTSKKTYEGALNRAKNCLKAIPDADYGVGIEGGLNPFFDQKKFMLLIWGAVVSKERLVGSGGGGGYPLPKKLTDELKTGQEFFEISEKHFKHKNVKQTTGTIGLLTNGALDRTKASMNAVIQALIPHKNKELYEN